VSLHGRSCGAIPLLLWGFDDGRPDGMVSGRVASSIPPFHPPRTLSLPVVFGRDGPDLLLRQIKENKSMFMEVDEEEYAKLVAKRRQEDFVEDDGV
jgi:hypothetical protein